MDENNYIIGEHYINQFKVGDCVSWKTLKNELIVGFIIKLYINKPKERQIAFAKVATSEGFIDLALIHLRLHRTRTELCATEETNNLALKKS
jgi:hypothetical protein